jgi:hypothetical protein
VLRRCNVKTRSRAASLQNFAQCTLRRRAAASTAPSSPHCGEPPALTGCPHRGTNGFRALNPHRGAWAWGTMMTRELHVYDHASGMIALLFVSPNGTVEAFDVEGFSRIGEFASVVEAATFVCADVEMPRLDS